MPSLVLASASPRRRELLASVGLTFTVDVPDVPEIPAPGEDAAAYGLRVATAKADAVAQRRAGEVVLAADTEVVLDGRILGKPESPVHARALLASLAGRWHEVSTAVAVVGPLRREQLRVVARVAMRPLTRGEIDWYVDTGEPLGKAGAYAIQGRGASIVTAVEGSYTAVVGLPLPEALGMLERAGLELPWSAR